MKASMSMRFDAARGLRVPVVLIPNGIELPPDDPHRVSPAVEADGRSV